MLTSCFELPVQAHPEKIWAYYEDFALRKSWEHGLESYELHGPFATGTQGSMALAGMPPIHFTLTKVETYREYWDTVSITGLGELLFGHEVFTLNKTQYIRHTITLTPEGDAVTDTHFNFFRQVTNDLSDMLWSLKTQVER